MSFSREIQWVPPQLQQGPQETDIPRNIGVREENDSCQIVMAIPIGPDDATSHGDATAVVAEVVAMEADSFFLWVELRAWVKGLVIFVPLVAVALILGVVLSMSHGTDRAATTPSIQAPSTMAPTNSTGPPATLLPTNPRRTYILETLGDQIAPDSTTLDLFELPETPQARALRWLSEEDVLSSDLQSMSTFVLLERYVLALLYFSTVGPEWLFDFPFLDAMTSVCEWNKGSTQGTDDDNANGIYCLVSGDIELVDSLQLQKMGLSGTIPWELSLLEQLHTLNVGNNGLRGTIPTELGSLSNLRKLRAEGNALTGRLPDEWGSKLEELDLSYNYLMEELPSALGDSSSKLKRLRLGSNNIRGTIPTEFGKNLPVLETLELASNDIHGAVPTEIGWMTLLQDLLLEENSLSGSLPSKIGHLSLLSELSVWGNTEMSGTVPDEYSNLSSLIRFSLENTSITGSLDSIFCTMQQETDPKLYADCLGEEPQVECSCCYYCCFSDGAECDYM